ncbi:Orf y [Tanacetum coccineum]
MFKNKYKDDRGKVRKCKCFVCGKEGHFARDCKSKNGNIARSAVYQELNIPKEWDIVSADFSDKSSVYSISEGEGEFQAGTAIGREEYMFMVNEKDYEEESDNEEGTAGVNGGTVSGQQVQWANWNAFVNRFRMSGDMTFLRKKGKSGAAVGKLVLLQVIILLAEHWEHLSRVDIKT